MERQGSDTQILEFSELTVSIGVPVISVQEVVFPSRRHAAVAVDLGRCVQNLGRRVTLEAETAPAAPPPVSNTAILIERALTTSSTLVILEVRRTTELEMVWTWPSKLVPLRTSGPDISRSSLNYSSIVGPERPYISPSSGEEPSGEPKF